MAQQPINAISVGEPTANGLPTTKIILSETQGAKLFTSPLRLIIDPMLDQGVPMTTILKKLQKDYPNEAPVLGTLRAYRRNYYLPSRGVTAENMQALAAKPLPPSPAPAVDATLVPLSVDAIETDIRDLYTRISKLEKSCLKPFLVGDKEELREVVDLDVEKAINDLYKTINSMRELRQKYHIDQVAEASKAQMAAEVARIALQVFVPALDEKVRRMLVDQFKVQLNDILVVKTAPVDDKQTPPVA